MSAPHRRFKIFLFFVLFLLCEQLPAVAQKDTVSLEPVVVTGQFSPRSLRNSVFNVRVLDRTQIEGKAAQDIESLLNTELGVRLSTDMTLGETDVELMGMSGSDVKVLIDGVPVVDRGENKQSLSQIDINSVERIEIVQGPMSVVYGTDALAGVINIITKKPKTSSDKDTWAVGAGLHEETVGKEYQPLYGAGLHTANVRFDWASKWGLYLSGGLTRNSSGGWRGDKTGRERMWSPKDQYLWGGTVGFVHNKFNIRYRLDYLDETIYNPLNGTDLNPGQISDRDYLTARWTHQLQGEWNAAKHLNVNFAASYQNYRRRTRTIVTDSGTGERWLSTDESAQDVSAMRSAFARVTATWSIDPKLTIQPGVDYKQDIASGDRIHGEPQITDVAGYISAEWRPVAWANIRPGLRSIFNSDYHAPAAIPALLAKFSLGNDLDLRLSFARGFRSPALRELYFSFHNSNHNIDGNPDLKAEYSTNYSAALTWRILHGSSVRLASTLTGFWNDFHDRITLATDVNDPTHITYYNIDRFKTTGGTLENALVWKRLTANLGVSLVGRYSRTGADDIFAVSDTRFRFSPEATANVGYAIAKTGTTLNLFYKFTGSRYEYVFAIGDTQAGMQKMQSYNWADITISQKCGKWFSVNAGVKNLFNVTTVEGPSGGPMGAIAGVALVGCGRSFFAGVAFNIANN